MTDDATIRRQVIAILKDMIAAAEARFDAELEPEPTQPEPTPEPEQPARKPSGWDWYTKLHLAIPSAINQLHFDAGNVPTSGWALSSCGIRNQPSQMTRDPRQVGCNRCRNTIAWGNAAIAILWPAPSATPSATASTTH